MIGSFLADERGQAGLGNIIGQATGRIGQVLETPSGSEGGEFDTLSEAQMTSFTGSTLIDGEFVEVANFVVPAQTGYTWGFGEPRPGKSDNQGRIYADPADGSGDVVGRLRLKSRNAVGKNIDDHGTFHTSRLRATLNDPTTWKFLPERDMPIVGEDSELYYAFEMDASASTGSSITRADSTIRTDVTEFS